jgi:hypothetical protein
MERVIRNSILYRFLKGKFYFNIPRYMTISYSLMVGLLQV